MDANSNNLVFANVLLHSRRTVNIPPTTSTDFRSSTFRHALDDNAFSARNEVSCSLNPAAVGAQLNKHTPVKLRLPFRNAEFQRKTSTELHTRLRPNEIFHSSQGVTLSRHPGFEALPKRARFEGAVQSPRNEPVSRGRSNLLQTSHDRGFLVSTAL